MNNKLAGAGPSGGLDSMPKQYPKTKRLRRVRTTEDAQRVCTHDSWW